MSEVQVTVNGNVHCIQQAETIDYDTIVRLAGKSGSHYTVVCHYRELKGSCPCPGESAPLEDGMIINVAYTGNA